MASPISSERRLLISIDDLCDDEVHRILHRARELNAGPIPLSHNPLVVGLLFLSPSLRTRVGFSVAALRLGHAVVDAVELRRDRFMSDGESFSDTVRMLGGMADLVVARTPFALDRGELRQSSFAPFVNGGDGQVEHPTQALIDLLAIETEKGPVSELCLGICGDLGMRSVRSLLRLLSRFRPASLILMGVTGRGMSDDCVGPELRARTTERASLDPTGVDVLYMAGLPQSNGESTADVNERATFALTAERLRLMSDEAVILSPMPVVDEIDPDVRDDPRVRMFEQSDRGTSLRMAVIEFMLASR